MRAAACGIVAAMVLVAAIALAAALAGCSASAAAPMQPPVTGLVVTINYSGDVSTVRVSGAAEASGRHFGPYVLSSDTLQPGGTVGLIFDASDVGNAMVCAQSRDSNGNTIDYTCDLFPVIANQVVDGSLTLESHR